MLPSGLRRRAGFRAGWVVRNAKEARGSGREGHSDGSGGAHRVYAPGRAGGHHPPRGRVDNRTRPVGDPGLRDRVPGSWGKDRRDEDAGRGDRGPGHIVTLAVAGVPTSTIHGRAPDGSLGYRGMVSRRKRPPYLMGYAGAAVPRLPAPQGGSVG